MNVNELDVNDGRFNRQGIFYLYLVDALETCLAEIYLQIGQNYDFLKICVIVIAQ